MKIIKYTLDGHNYTVSPSMEMFNHDSYSRTALAERGVMFETDDAVLAWVIAKDVPQGVEYEITES